MKKGLSNAKIDGCKVKLIEESRLGLDARVELLLVYAEQKPATQIHIAFGIDYDPEADCFHSVEENINNFEELFGTLNLRYTFEKTRSFVNDDLIYTFRPGNGVTLLSKMPVIEARMYIASNSDFLIRILKADKTQDERELGRCFGFPETAIQAYLGERREFYGFFGGSTPLRYFTQYVFSADHYEEELKTSKRWHDAIKGYSPRLYKEINIWLVERGL